MKLPFLYINGLTAQLPIVQGGMGVGVSMSGLSSAVANEGGVGTISCAQIGFRESDFLTNTKDANIRAIGKEISRARELNTAKKGIIAMNIMVAMDDYDDLVRECVNQKIDLIVSGAGLPLKLPALVKGSSTRIAPIVSSGRAASLISKTWDRRYSSTPDMVVVEGPKAGGHLGFKMDELKNNMQPKLEDIVVDVIKVMKVYEKKYNKHIPVIAGGGIYDGGDIARFIKLGASGVQMATRFVATNECDADIRFKQAYLNARQEDIELITSPVGMPGRAIHNAFIDKVENGDTAPKKCYKCIKTCDPKTAPYCITKALIEAVNGNLEDGLVFTGTNSYRLDKIIPVKQLIKELVDEANEALNS